MFSEGSVGVHISRIPNTGNKLVYPIRTSELIPSYGVALPFIMCCQYGNLWIFINTLRPRQNGRHFPDDIFKCIFLNENVWISIKISLKFVPGGPNNNFPALVQIMAWRRPGDKPWSELMMVSLLTHISVTRPQWVNLRITRCPITTWAANVVGINVIGIWRDPPSERHWLFQMVRFPCCPA